MQGFFALRYVKEMARVLPGFSHQKSVERLIKNVTRKEEINNKDVYEVVLIVQKKTNRKGAAIMKFKNVGIYKILEIRKYYQVLKKNCIHCSTVI